MIKNILCALGLALTLGCATAVVRPYVGEQQTWPTADGAIVNVRYDLPIFTSLPPSPYEVLAQLRISSPLYAEPEEGHLGILVNKAVELGADALVFVDGQVFFSTQFGASTTGNGTSTGKKISIAEVNRFNPDSFRPGVTIIAIRWTDGSPAGLPPRYAKYTAKMLESGSPAASTPSAPASPTPATPVEPQPNATAKPAAPEPPPAAPVTPAPVTPVTPKVEATPPAVATPALTLPATPETK